MELGTMLQSMREKMSGWLTGVIIGIICLVFVLFGVSSYFGSSRPESKSVVTVGDQSITEGDINNYLTQVRRQLFAAGERNLNNPELRENALTQLINNKLQYVGADKMGVNVGVNQIDQYIYHIPEFMDKGSFSMDKYKMFISSSGYTTARLRSYLKDRMMIAQARSALLGTDFILPNEELNYSQLMRQTRKIKYIKFEGKDYSSKAVPSLFEMKEYYKEHSSSFMMPEEVNLEYLLLDFNSIKKKIIVSDAEAKSYYEDHKNEYHTLEKRKLSKIYIRFSFDSNALIKANMLTHKLKVLVNDAKKTQNPEASLIKMLTKDNIKFNLEKSKLLLTYQQAKIKGVDNIFTLKAIGDISGLIKVKEGFIVNVLSEINKPKYMPYSSVKDSIISNIKQEKAEVLYSTLGNKLQNYVFENPDSLEYASRRLNIHIQETGLFSRKGLGSGIASHKDVIRVAFSDSVLKEKNNSDIINISNHKALVVRVKDFNPARVKPFDLVKNKIFALLKIKKEQALARSSANKIAHVINEKGLSDYSHLNWKEMIVSRTDKTLPMESISELYSRKISNNAKPKLFVVDDGKGGSILYYVITKSSHVGKVTKKELEKWNKVLEGVYMLNLENNYMNFLRNTTDIKYAK